MRHFTVEITRPDGETFYTKVFPNFSDALDKATTIKSWSPEVIVTVVPLELKVRERR